MGIKDLLQLTVDRNASDLHVLSGMPPILRVDGVLQAIASEPILTPDVVDLMVNEVLNAEQVERYKINKELDFSLSFSEKARFRVNAYVQKGSSAIAFRRIPLTIPGIDSLNLPKILHSFTTLKQGLILVTGPTGHGKSTAIASIIEEINLNRAVHILTIEDPVEFVFTPKKAIISQREMGKDTNSWNVALRSALREDPDVVLVGEMRDYETIASTMTIAETGHLVFATLHTNSASQAVDRIVDVFPEHQQDQIKLQLSNVIEAVFSLRLVPKIGTGRLPAYELMLGTQAIKTVVREGKTHQIDSIIQTSTEVGMRTLEASLSVLVKEGKITVETAQAWSLRPEELNRLITK